MKKLFLNVLLALIFASASFGQYYGTVYYNLNATATPYVTIDGVASTTNTITYDGSGVTVTDDGNALALSQGSSSTAIAQNSGHGAILKNGHTISMKVSAKATISFIVCKYGQTGSYSFKDESGNEIGTINPVSATDADTVTISYSGTAQTLTATLTTTGSNYLHGIILTNIETLPSLEGKTLVWDFGAEQFSGEDTVNMLNNDSINAWYTGMTISADSTGMNLPQTFTTGGLTWYGKASSDRLRTANTKLIRYDTKSNGVYTGYVYANGVVTVTSGLPGNRYFSLKLEEQDEVSVVDMGNNGVARVTFVYKDDPTIQNEYKEATQGSATKVDFIAKEAGTYLIYDAKDKGSFFRITRKNADYVTVSGTVDESNVSLDISGYGIVFSNQDADIDWTAIVSNGTYSIDLPAGHIYDLSLSDANGVIITSTDSIDVTEATTFDVTLLQVTLNTVSGTITGLGDEIANLTLAFNADADLNKIYIPEPTIAMSTPTPTYSVFLESECKYTIEATGVNDYELVSDTITIHLRDSVFNIEFTAKPVYDITIEIEGLTDAQKDSLKLTFTNIYEEGYEYLFDSLSGIQLRDGVYSIGYTGLDDFAVELALTSNITVDGTTASKTLTFVPVSVWSFDDYDVDGVSYKGLQFTGNVASEYAKGHLSISPSSTIKVPVSVGDKMRLSYYNSAHIVIGGTDTAYTTSGSTSTLEYIDYVYPEDTNGYITLTIDSIKTYITEIEVYALVAYSDTIYVGTDKEYQTINGALSAIATMDRPNDERVVVMIDPGNYEEMIVINLPNVTFTNASAEPSIGLLNNGVDIDDNAVRITSYYGHGYSYYSMGNDQKWNEDVLRVNKENGYLSYENAGSGTTNGSYWNATMVVSADGFEANFIIIENSYNQYISQKESEDVVVEWESGGKGTRPTDAGNTSVQDKTYVERAAAIAVISDKVVLNLCRVIGRQDSFYGGKSSRVVIYKGEMMGATDYIFGGMIAVFYKSNLVMNTSENSNDRCYITAAQQESGRGYLMYECNVTSAVPGSETASEYLSKPGYFGRPWLANTSEVVFYNTTIDTTNFTGSEGKSLIEPEGWLNSLGGQSPLMYEYGTVEVSGVDNSASRVSWATLLTNPKLNDSTEITCFNFTKGSDDWDPLPGLIAGDTIMVIDTTITDTIPNDTIPNDTTPNDTTPTDTVGIRTVKTIDQISVYSNQDQVYVKNISSETLIYIYNVNGSLVAKKETTSDITFTLEKGFYIIKIIANSEQKAVKVVSQ